MYYGKKLKHPACTIGWVARLCHSWLSPGNFLWEKSHWNNKVVKKNAAESDCIRDFDVNFVSQCASEDSGHSGANRGAAKDVGQTSAKWTTAGVPTV